MSYMPFAHARRGRPKPTSNFDFGAGGVPTGGTFTRASVAQSFDYRGLLAQSAVDVLRTAYDPALEYNMLPNPWMDGAAAGSPGVVPNVWSAGGTLPNRTITSVASVDGVPSFTVQMSGVSSGTFYAISPAAGAPGRFPARVGDVVTTTFQALRRAGALGDNFRVLLRQYDAAGTYLGDVFSGNLVPASSGGLDAATLSVSQTVALANTAFVEPFIQIGLTNGLPYDFTLTLGFPTSTVRATAITNRVPLATLMQRVGTTPQYGLLGALLEEAATNLFLNSAVGVTQGVTVTAVPHTLAFTGTGSITLTGASTAGPLVGTGANNRVSLSFTPSAGTLTLTIAGDVRLVQLEALSFPTSYIPSTGTAGVRARDNLSFDGLVISTNAASYAVRFALARFGSAGEWTAVPRFVFFSGDPANSNNVSIRTDASRIASVVLRSGAVQVAGIARAGALVDAVGTTACVGWGGGSASVAFDGGVAVDDASAPDPAVAPIRVRVNDDRNLANGAGIYLRFLRVWAGKRLSAAQVQRESRRVD